MLHLLDHLLDIKRRHCRLVSQPADLTGHHQKARAVFARLLGLDRRVDGEQVRLVSHLRDRGDREVDGRGPLTNLRQLGTERQRAVGELPHGAIHAGEVLPTVGRHQARMGGHVVDLGHRAQQFLTGGRNLLDRRDRLACRGTVVGDHLLLLAGGGLDRGGGRDQRDRRFLDPPDQPPQVVGHRLDGIQKDPCFVVAVSGDFTGHT